MTSYRSFKLRRAVIWIVDSAGPSEHRLARRAAVVRVRELFVRRCRRASPRHRRLHRDRLATIRELETVLPAKQTRGGPIRTVAIHGNMADRRFGVIIPGFLSGFGGAEKVAGQLAALLGRSGGLVDLICVRSPDTVRPYELPPGVRLQMLDDLDDFSKLIGERYDLIVAFGMPGFYRRIPSVAQILDVPFVIQECTNPTSMQKALKSSLSLETDQEAYWLRQTVLAHAAAVRFTTPGYARTVEPEIEPFTFGFFNAFPQSGREGPSASSAQRKLICVGGLKNRNKNGLVAAEAFCRFHSRHPDWSLHFYGENNFRSALAGLQRRCALAIIDAGVEKDIGRIYSNACALIIPSFEEGLPNVVIEAFTFGVPCIGFDDCEGVRQLITHEENGLLVDRRDVSALVEAMNRLADPQCRARLSANALAFARAELDVAVWEKRWLELVAHALGCRDARGNPAQPAALCSNSGRSAAWRRLLSTYPLTG
jgi:glycosyltransferase involved in cell wall biosynthesis